MNSSGIPFVALTPSRKVTILAFFDMMLLAIIYFVLVGTDAENRQFDDSEVTHFSFLTSLFDVFIVNVTRSCVIMILYGVLSFSSLVPIVGSSMVYSVFLVAKAAVFQSNSALHHAMCLIFLLSSFFVAWAEFWLWYRWCLRLSLNQGEKSLAGSLSSEKSPIISPCLFEESSYGSSNLTAHNIRMVQHHSDPHTAIHSQPPDSVQIQMNPPLSAIRVRQTELSVDDSRHVSVGPPPTVSTAHVSDTASVFQQNVVTVIKLTHDEDEDDQDDFQSLPPSPTRTRAGSVDSLNEIDAMALEISRVAQEGLLMDFTTMDGWTAQGTRDGVQVFSKTLILDSASTVNCMMGKILVRATPDQVASFILSDANRSRFDPMSKSQDLVHRTNDRTTVLHIVYKSPSRFVAPRDFVLVRQVTKRKDGSFVVSGRSIDLSEQCPIPSGVVRGEILGGGYIFTPAPGGCTEVTFVAKTDLKGNIPGFVMKLVAREQPLCLIAIRKCIEEDLGLV
jgi:hypothetical protein